MLRAELRLVLIVFIVGYFINSPAVSISYKLIGDWQRVSNQEESYNKSGWITYSINTPKIAGIEVTQRGDFFFAWRMDRLEANNKLYFKNELLDNSIIFKESYSSEVDANETLKWVFSISDPDGGQAWIALPPQTAQDDTLDFKSSEVNSPNGSIVQNGANETSGPIITSDISVASKNQISKRITNGWNLNEEINSCQDNTNIMLVGKININKTLVIKSKKNLTISSEEGQAELDGYGIDKLVLIEGSNHITIKKLKINNSTNSIEIKNCSHINISDNELIFSFPGKGIIIENGEFNNVARNYIYNVSNINDSIEYCEGINLTSTRYNNITSNVIYSSNVFGKICQYVLRNSTNKCNLITFSAPLNGLLVAQDQFIGEWNCDLLAFDCVVNNHCPSGDCICRIHDLQDDPLIWEP